MISPDCQEVIAIAQATGDILLKHFGQKLQVEFKLNKFDPVTQADREADAFIRERLAKAFPGDAIVSEEHPFRPARYDKRVWMADPLDGTKDFVAGLDGFSVIIGLLQDGKPRLGVVYLPARSVLYFAEVGQGAYQRHGGTEQRLQVSSIKDIHQAKLLTRNAHPGDIRPVEELLDQLPFSKRISEGSIGTKVSRVAAGEAECFVHTNDKACKWDTLGAETIIAEAGGMLTDLAGKPLDYAQPAIRWGKLFVAANNRTIHQQVLAGLRGYEAQLKR